MDKRPEQTTEPCAAKSIPTVEDELNIWLENQLKQLEHQFDEFVTVSSIRKSFRRGVWK